MFRGINNVNNEKTVNVNEVDISNDNLMSQLVESLNKVCIYILLRNIYWMINE